MVRADNLRFKEEGVRDVLKDVFLPWYNAYRFLIQNVIQFHKVSAALGLVALLRAGFLLRFAKHIPHFC